VFFEEKLSGEGKYTYKTVLGMHRILFLPDIRPAGYPANPKAGYRISEKGRIPDIR
jgi:hypothetical protein